MSVSNVVILIAAGQQSGNGSQLFLGIMLVIINAVTYTIYFVIVKLLMPKYNSVQVIRSVFACGFFMVLPFNWTKFAAIIWESLGQ